jgi:hypothetical protein
LSVRHVLSLCCLHTFLQKTLDISCRSRPGQDGGCRDPQLAQIGGWRDHSQPRRFYARFSLLVIDEFDFDRIERSLCPRAASLWYKIIDARSQQHFTALITNIDFGDWAEYLSMRFSRWSS